MTARSLASPTAETGSGASGVVLPIPPEAQVGDVLTILWVRSGGSSTAELVAVASAGGAVTELIPASDASGSVAAGSNARWGVVQRIVTTDDLEDGESISLSTPPTTGRWVAVAACDYDVDPVPVGAAGGDSGASSHNAGGITPASGAAGTALYFAAYAGSWGSQEATFTATKPIRGQASTAGSTGLNAAGVTYAAPWTGTGAVGTESATPSIGGYSNRGAGVVLYKASTTAPAQPAVSAGPDQTKATSSAPFGISGQATAPSGTAIASHLWERVSGPTGLLASTTSQTVQVTPPSSPGTLVLRYTATTDAGGSNSDEVVITFVAVGQSLRPIGDVSNPGLWTSTPSAPTLAAALDEAEPDPADYISSPSAATDAAATVALQPGAPPGTALGQVLEVQVWRDPAVATHSLLVELLEGDTVRASVTLTDLTTAPTIRPLALSEAESASIVDWSNLRVRLTATTA